MDTVGAMKVLEGVDASRRAGWAQFFALRDRVGESSERPRHERAHPPRTNPTVEHYRHALWKSSLPPTQRFVALAMAEFMDFRDLGNAHPGPALVAERTGFSSRTVIRALRQLVEAGWLIQIAKGGSFGGSKAASTYRGAIPS